MTDCAVLSSVGRKGERKPVSNAYENSDYPNKSLAYRHHHSNEDLQLTGMYYLRLVTAPVLDVNLFSGIRYDLQLCQDFILEARGVQKAISFISVQHTAFWLHKIY